MANGDDNGGGGGNGGLGLGTGDAFLDAVGYAIILAVIIRLYHTLPEFLAETFGGIWSSISGTSVWVSTYEIIYILSVGFAAACIAGSIYAGVQLSRVRVAERKELNELTRAAIGGEVTENERWQQILSYAASDDEELWRLAIIEADVMLDEMMQTMGYQQDSLGEKLRSVERSDFRTIDEAWEAHKVRNIVAHEGSTYDLNRRELERTIDNYRQVFKEFSYI